MIRAGRFINFLIWLTAFVVAIYSFSAMMELLLTILASEPSLPASFQLIGYSIAIAFAMVVLARGIYRLDRRAGRIRNKVGWFE